MSSTKQVTYNTGTAVELIGCTNFLARNDPGYIFFLVTLSIGMLILWGFLVAYSVPVPYFEVFCTFGILLVAPYLLNSLMVMMMVASPQNCTTMISDWGVIDRTEKWAETKASWKSIRSIRFDKGSIYFLSFTRSVYVPHYAFESSEEALAYYNQALTLWREAKDKKIAARIADVDNVFSIGTDSIASIQEFDAQEEAMWNKMEEEHKKKKQTD